MQDIDRGEPTPPFVLNGRLQQAYKEYFAAKFNPSGKPLFTQRMKVTEYLQAELESPDSNLQNMIDLLESSEATKAYSTTFLTLAITGPTYGMPFEKHACFKLLDMENPSSGGVFDRERVKEIEYMAFKLWKNTGNALAYMQEHELSSPFLTDQPLKGQHTMIIELLEEWDKRNTWKNILGSHLWYVYAPN